MTAGAIPPSRMRLLVAASSLARMIRSRGTDLRHALLFIRALEGKSERKAFERFRRTESGQRLLRMRPDLVACLMRAEQGDGFAPGTVAHTYHLFLRQQGFSVAKLMELAATPFDRALPADEAWVQERARVMHDLWHVVTGYDGSAIGEVCLMAFRVAQVPHLAFYILTLGLLIKPLRHAPGAPIRRAIVEAWRLGKQAAWLRAVEWEVLMPLSLDEARRQLRLQPPVTYQRLMAMNAAWCEISASESAGTPAPAPFS